MTEQAAGRAPAWDLVSLGEVMLRLDPGEGRIHTSRTFRAWEGGGEYNVARALRRCFGLRTAVVTALADNPVGRLIEDLMLQGGVDLEMLLWRTFDGVGRVTRNALNFTERGFGVRGAVGASERAGSAASQLTAGEIDWQHVFGVRGARWLHTGGIFAALSETTAAVILEAIEAAHAQGALVSYDLNYRASLWASHGGAERAQAVNREIVTGVDVLFGNEEDFSTALGFAVPGLDDRLSNIEAAGFHAMIEDVVAAYPNLVAVGTSLRTVRTATRNDWGALLWHGGTVYTATHRPDLEILDRVGGGDSFASGVIYGLLTDQGPQQAVEIGAAHGALAMTTPGDVSMASLSEVLRLVAGGSARVVR
jgi:2-dehydro-3-deoxygluconokinase